MLKNEIVLLDPYSEALCPPYPVSSHKRECRSLLGVLSLIPSAPRTNLTIYMNKTDTVCLHCCLQFLVMISVWLRRFHLGCEIQNT